jgi:hypothetical protein
MKVILKVDKNNKVVNLGFDGQMDSQDSPMGLDFNAWLARQNNLGRKCEIVQDEPGTDGKDRSVTLEWSK